MSSRKSYFEARNKGLSARDPHVGSLSAIHQPVCMICGDRIMKDDQATWNGDYRSPMHNLCMNDPKNETQEEHWEKGRTPWMKDAHYISVALSKGRIPKERIGFYLKILDDIAANDTKSSHQRKVAIDALLKYRTNEHKAHIDRESLQLQREQFQFNRERLEAGMPTQIVGSIHDLASRASDILGEISAIKARVFDEGADAKALPPGQGS